MNNAFRRCASNRAIRAGLFILLVILMLIPISFNVRIAYADPDSPVEAYFYIRKDGVIPYNTPYAVDDYTPRGDNLYAAKGELNEAIPYEYDPDAVLANVTKAPASTMIDLILQSVGISFDSHTQRIVWYSELPFDDGTDAYRVLGLVVSDGSYLLRYASSDDASDVSGVPAAEPYEGSQTIKLSDTEPTRDGFSFLGWSDDPYATVPVYGRGADFVMPSSNTTLYAVWQQEEIEISFVADPADGGTVDTNFIYIESEDDSNLIDVKATPNSGYRFSGWYKGNDLITPDQVLTSKDSKGNLNKENGEYVPTTFVARFTPMNDNDSQVDNGSGDAPDDSSADSDKQQGYPLQATGDNSDLIVWAALFISIFAALTVLLTLRRRLLKPIR